MKDLSAIIEDYRQSDSERRLYLFLDCPQLRNEFLKTDLSEYSPEQCEQSSMSNDVKQSGFQKVCATMRHAWSFKCL
jgi:hypothetical protein